MKFGGHFFCAEQTSNTNICTSDDSDPVEPAVEDEAYEYKRGNKSCIMLTVGDQGTNNVIRGVKGQSERLHTVGVLKFRVTCIQYSAS